MAAEYATSKPLISTWSSTPIPNLSLSAAGLLALADLHTIAQRTVITGGSSWLDALVLAPGLHYQQAVDALDYEPGLTAVFDADKGNETRYTINNAAMAQYIRRLWQANKQGELTLNVGVFKEGSAREQMEKLTHVLGGMVTRRQPKVASVEMDWLSHVFYLASPVLTIAAGTFMILLADWWGLACIVALMVSRMLNIWSIKQRSKQAVSQAGEDSQAQYAVDLGNGCRVILKGMSSDLQAMTTQTWLRAQSTTEGYLEAGAKLLVYLVAAFSGNQTQAGALVLMALLVVSAALLGLSNAHARGLQMNGRVARLEREDARVDAEKGETAGSRKKDTL